MTDAETPKKSGLRGVGLFGVAIIGVAALLWGQIIWNNLRADDPLLEGWEPYSEAGFEAAIATGGPVVVEIYASWCPVCIVQHQVFEEVWSTQTYPTLTAIRVDFDKDRAFIEKHNVEATGLLLYFRNGA